MSHREHLENIVKEQEKKFTDEVVLYKDKAKNLQKEFDSALETSNISKISDIYQRAKAAKSDMGTLAREIDLRVDGMHMFTNVKNELSKYKVEILDTVQYIEDAIKEHGIQISIGNERYPYCRARR